MNGAAIAEFEAVARKLCEQYPNYEELDPLRKLLGLPLYFDTLGAVPDQAAPGDESVAARKDGAGVVPYSPQDFEVVAYRMHSAWTREDALARLRGEHTPPEAALARIKAHTEGLRTQNAEKAQWVSEMRKRELRHQDLIEGLHNRVAELEAGLQKALDDGGISDSTVRSLLATTDSGESARLSSTPTEMAMRLRQSPSEP